MEKKGDGDRKVEQLIKVARMYYEQEMSQEEIAKEIKCSRPYISRLLADAKEAGIVQVKVIPPKGYEQAMEAKIKRNLGGLDKVIIVPKKNNASKLDIVAKAAAEYLENVVR